MHKQLNDLLQKKMDRKDFLKHVAIGAVLISGAGSLVKVLQQTNTPSGSQTSNKGASLAYGSSAYGGAEIPNKKS